MTATLYALVGPPGAGKTSLRTRFPDAVVVSLDALRALYSCCDMNQDPKLRDVVVRFARAQARAALSGGLDVLWDATNARDEHRRQLVELAHGWRARAVAVLVLPPPDVVLARNATRSAEQCAGCGYARRVPDDIVRSMWTAITDDLHGLNGEGWDEVRVGTLADCPGVPR